MRISLPGCGTGKRKTLLSELGRRAEWELWKDTRSSVPSEDREWRHHGCRLKAGEPGWANNREGFYSSRKVPWIRVTDNARRLGAHCLLRHQVFWIWSNKSLHCQGSETSLVPHWNALYIYFHFWNRYKTLEPVIVLNCLSFWDLAVTLIQFFMT